MKIYFGRKILVCFSKSLDPDPHRKVGSPVLHIYGPLYLVFLWLDLGPGAGEGALVSALSGGENHPENPLKM